MHLYYFFSITVFSAKYFRSGYIIVHETCYSLYFTRSNNMCIRRRGRERGKACGMPEGRRSAEERGERWKGGERSVRGKG